MMVNEASSGAEHHDVDFRAELQRAIEAILFAATEPVDSARLANVFGEVTGFNSVTATNVDDAVHDLNEVYEADGRSLRIRSWGGGYRLTTDSEVSAYVNAFLQEDRSRRLSRTLLETLAIVAYRQPVTRPEIDFVRGVDSDYAVRKLMELHLVDVVGRSETLGRPLLYGTTSHFLEQFGLQDLGGLPTLREVEEILNDPAFKRERADLLAFQEQERAIDDVNVAELPEQSDQKVDEDHGEAQA